MLEDFSSFTFPKVITILTPISNHNKKPPVGYNSWIKEIYLDQPKSGGTAQLLAMIHVKIMPAKAWFEENLKLPIGLHTTMYLSTASTTRDQRET